MHGGDAVTPRIGSLFSGYGGLDMAVQAVYGGEVAWYSEIDKHACTVLEALHPAVPNLGDITAVDWAAVPPIDILTGGYPCQPFSTAGNRKGTNDERHLWPYVRDAINALRPVVTVLENVDGHRSLGLDVVLGDLADLGLSARWGVVRAADAGAPHGRKRVFIIVTDADGTGLQRPSGATGETQAARQGHVEQGAGVIAADATGTERRESQSADMGSSLGSATELGERSGAATNADRGGHGRGQDSRGVAGVEGLHERSPRERERSRAESVPGGGVDWGKYAPAIRRWESLTRPAPDPTVHRGQRPRLNPQFVEWMMGLPEGHVTGHGLKPAACLKMLGNGVVPQQAELALRMLEANDA